MKSSALIVTINGSPSATSRTRRLLDHVAHRLAEQSFRTEAVRVRDLPAQALLHGRSDDPAVLQAIEWVERAAAVVIGTPVYKSAYSGLLKTFLDLLPRQALSDKIVLPLATGGSAAHTLALDYSLRPVLAALGARHVLPSIYAVETQVRWSEDGGLDLDADINARLAEGVERLADALPAPTIAAPSARPSLKLLNTPAVGRC
jgi:FMN reductase